MNSAIEMVSRQILGTGEIASRYYTGVKLARHIRRIPAVIAFLILLEGVAASVPSAPQQPQPPGQVPGGPAAARARVPNPKLEARKAPPLILTPSWTIDLPSPPFPGAVVDATRAYVPLRSSELVAILITGGATAWKTPVDEIAGPLAIGDGLVFLAHARQVEAVEAGTGASRWRVPIDGPISAPLLWHDHQLLAVTEHGSATMVRAATGEILWTRSLGPSHIEPAATDGLVYLALDDGRVAALASESGRTAWETKLPAPVTTLASLGDRVFAGASDKFLYCLSGNRGKTKWRWRTGAPVVGRMAVDKHHVYFVALDNVLRALNRGNGNQIWKAAIPHRPTAGVFLASRLLWVPGVAAEVAAFQTIDGTQVGVSPLAGEPVAMPQLSLSAPDRFDGAFVVTGEGQAQWLVPGPPPLPSKPVPGLPAFTLPPEIKGYLPAIGAL
jgi:outer membrane protein assembly factor BamB